MPVVPEVPKVTRVPRVPEVPKVRERFGKTATGDRHSLGSFCVPTLEFTLQLLPGPEAS